MSTNPQIYSRVDVYFDGLLLVEEATISLKRKTNSTAMNSVQKDYAGESPGAKGLEATITQGVPTAGFELEFGKYMKNLVFGELTLYCAGKVLRSKGTFIDDSLDGGVDKPTQSMGNFRGAYADWE